ncbi:MAG: ATP-binding cassette domain-containing protein [Pirellulaceae bacterium]|jgi:ABC-2 type transport system ATP-binding protein
MVGLHSSDPPAMELRRLHRFFGPTAAVQDVTFDVMPGHVFGFIGPNGAGKTTTMRILATLDTPTYGDAMVQGHSVVNDPELVRQAMGFMPDGFGTYTNMDCVEYLDFFARAYGLVGRDRTSAVRQTLGFTGLDKIASKPIRGLSKGMRQRLCLGRALIHDPAVLILDEPANGLDPRARIELRQMIQALAARGKAVLVSSHILTELAEMANAVGIIERGRLLAVGPLEDIQNSCRRHSKIRIRTHQPQPALASWLQGRPQVDQVEVDKDVATFVFTGDAHEQAQLVRALCDANFPVLEVMSQEQSLEDLFMQITTGAVQ